MEFPSVKELNKMYADILKNSPEIEALSEWHKKGEIWNTGGECNEEEYARRALNPENIKAAHDLFERTLKSIPPQTF